MTQNDRYITERITANLSPEDHTKALQIHLAALATAELALERNEAERRSLARSVSMRRYALHLLRLHPPANDEGKD